MKKNARAIIAGATGYSGRELIRLLSAHRHFEIAALYASRNAPVTPVAGIHPQLTGLVDIPCRPFDEADAGAVIAAGRAAGQETVVFLATPNEFSLEITPALLETGATVVDISGAFRLRDAALYPQFYGFEHTRPDLLETAVYGLTEFVRPQLPGAKLIANPGCYPTSILIPVTPLMRAGLVAAGQPVICDSKSGVTGAGKTPTAKTHFCEVTESFSTYNIFRHRHQPEIAQGLGLDRGAASLIFTPHLLPISRGILSTIYLRLNPGVTRADVYAVWNEAFAGAPFVRIFAGARGTEMMPEIKFVANTPFCDIGCEVDASGQAVIVAAEDNLLKGAASQALQNANLALGFDEKEGMI
ncbi:MAG: N-acetyl-gamma-glutamyl-phosphate reductase [Blastocatellia bacterium]